MQNFYEKKEVKKYCVKADNPNYDMHHFDTPFRSLVVAPSGSGKSNFITNLISLFCKGKEGTFDNIYIFCKSRDEPLYQFLGDKSK
jgi:ABC-type lipoprotein export system ATPase subunit